MLVALCINFNEDGVLTRGVMALYNLRNLFQHLHHLIEQTGFFEKNTHKSTGMKTNFRRIKYEFRTFDYPNVHQTLYPLMNGCARHFALPGYFQKRNARIFGYET